MTRQHEPTAVVLQHREDAPGGLLMDVLAGQGFSRRTVRVDLGESLPDPAGFRLAITLGSDGLVDGANSGSAAEIDWLRRADRAGTAVLGLGAGAQALAVALGGTVDPAPTARHRWVWVSSDTPGWIASGPWLAWRDAVIRLPPATTLLAHDPLGPQVFAAGGHLGVQFHPEVTPKILADWVTAERGHGLDAQGLLEGTSREFATASAAARRLLSTYIHSLA
jgi:GMP synthase-like glutamine amidotransferase